MVPRRLALGGRLRLGQRAGGRHRQASATVQHESPESQGFPHCPVHPRRRVLHHAPARLTELLHGGVGFKIGGQGCNGSAHPLQGGQRQPGRLLPLLPRRLRILAPRLECIPLPGGGDELGGAHIVDTRHGFPVLPLKPRAVALVPASHQGGHVQMCIRRCLCRRTGAVGACRRRREGVRGLLRCETVEICTGRFETSGKHIAVELQHAGVGVDRGTRQRHRGSWIIHLIVPVPPVAADVDDDVAPKLGTPFCGDAARSHHRLWIVCVRVQDRNAQSLRHICTVGAGPSFTRHGGEANLVVDHDMYRATCRESRQVAKLQGFSHDALPCEGGITMQHQTHHCRPPPVGGAS
mmetsp:Transcript_5121/g.14718  ORF Transcript_5121/g.14718 Transcript_5121/m.14718 type:complete len:351 (+) Transcript_5121:1975-3027(+)